MSPVCAGSRFWFQLNEIPVYGHGRSKTTGFRSAATQHWERREKHTFKHRKNLQVRLLTHTHARTHVPTPTYTQPVGDDENNLTPKHEEPKDVKVTLRYKDQKNISKYTVIIIYSSSIYSDYRHALWFFFIRMYINMYRLNCLKYYKYKYAFGHIRTICTAK